MEARVMGVAVNPAEETMAFAGLGIRFLLTGDNSLGSVAMFEMTVAGGKGLPGPAHSHDHYEETIYGLEGAMSWTVDGKRFDLGPGESLCIPRGAVHRFDNDASAEAKALCVITPAALGPEYFREVGEALRAAGGGPPDKALMMEIMKRHGLTPAPPPRQA